MTNRVQPTGVNAEIRAGLARRGLKQSDVAATLDLSQASVADRLTGRREWRLSELQKVADLLGVPTAALIEASEQDREAGRSEPSFLYATSVVLVLAVVLAAILVGWTLPPGTGLFVLVLAATAGLLVREGLRSHLNGLARLARAGHVRGRRD